MKKLITLAMLCLTTMVGNAAITVYVKAATAPHLWAWTKSGETTTNIFSDDWPGPQLSQTTLGIDGETYWYYTFEDQYTKVNFLFNNGSEKTADIDNITSDAYFTYNGNTVYENITSQVTAQFLNTHVCLPSSLNGWTAEKAAFTESNGVYTYELSTTSYTTFKLYPFNQWKGYADISITAPSGWTGNDSGNIYLDNQNCQTGYTSFTLTATEDNGNWSLDIKGKDALDFTIVGSADIVNGTTAWAVAEPANKMTDTDLDGTFYLTVSDLELAAGTYEYKVFRDLGDTWQCPANGQPSKTITINQNGIYDIEYKFVACSYDLSATVTLKVPVTVSHSSGWATCVTTNAVDFSKVSGLKAYTATVSSNTVTLAEAGVVPANTALVLKATTAKTYYVPTVGAAEPVSNDLQGSNEIGLTSLTETDNVYGLVVDGEGKAQFTKLTGDLAAGKAYLQLSNPARTLNVVFADDATGINTIAVQQKDSEVYNLGGQRVAQPQKGLYIIGGKKVIMK